MEYTNLHVHSEWSLLDGAAKVKDLALTVKNKGHRYLAVTDHGSVSGAKRHEAACQAQGIKPIFGCELYLAEQFDRIQDPEFEKFKNLHLTVLAKNQRGFEKIVRGLNYAHHHGTAKAGRAKRSFLPIRYPLENWTGGDVVLLSGCMGSPFWNLTDPNEGFKLFDEYANAFKDDFYGELMPLHDFDSQRLINEMAYTQALKNGRKYVVTNDSHYCHAEDWETHELVICMSQRGMTWDNPRRWKFESHLNYIREGDDMVQSLVKMGMTEEQARLGVITTMEIAEKCVYDTYTEAGKTKYGLKPYPMDLPSPLPPGTDETKYFYDACRRGMDELGLSGKPEYESRLLYEQKMIESKNFIRYMLIVGDVLKWARDSGIMTNVRGSASGSLVGHVLHISAIDPIKHDLVFERFIAPDRLDLPDADIDVADKDRGLIEQYLKEKYGPDNVAHVGTYSQMFGRSALRDVGRIHNVPLGEIDSAAKLLIKRPIADPREFFIIDDTLADSTEFYQFGQKYPHVVLAAAKLEGQLTRSGIHAAGFVVSTEKLHESNRAYLIDGNDGKKAVNWDMNDLQSFGYVKLDILGVNTLTVMNECLKLIKVNKGIDINLYKLPLYDEKAYKAMANGETATVFQIHTPSMTSYCKELQPENFDDVAALTALWRPGPIGAGQTKNYALMRHGKIKATSLCPEYEEIVKNTRYQLIYQEQFVRILTDIAAFEYVEADKVRKIISKSQGTEAIKAYQTKFVEGCKKAGKISEDMATKLWESLYEFGRYAFNKSHATAYGLITYWTMYLKVHYPAEYMTAYLNFGSTDKEYNEEETNLDVALRECRRLGLTILGPDINESLDGWCIIGDKTLRAGLKEVRFVGENAKTNLMVAKTTAGRINTMEQLFNSVERRSVNKRVVESLLFSGALDTLQDADTWKRNYDELYESYGKKRKFPGLFEEAKTKPYPPPKEEHKEGLLNYNLNILTEMDEITEQMAQKLGLTIMKGMEPPTLTDGKEFWSIYDARKGVMVGFNKKLIRSTSVPDEADITNRTRTCIACDLRKNPECSEPVPFDAGKYNVMILAESPGYYEDQKGQPLVGKSGKELWSMLNMVGLKRSMFYVDNTVHCKPENNRLDNYKYLDICTFADELVRKLQPVLVLALGNKPLYFFKGKESGIRAMNGITEWNKKYGCFVTYCIHPSNLLRTDRSDSREMFTKAINEFSRMFKLLGGSR